MDQLEFLRMALSELERINLSYALVGSYGSGFYGEPRFTRDIDIVLDLPSSQVTRFCAAFPPPDFYLSEAAVRDAVQSRFQFNLLHPESGNKIDFIMTRHEPWSAGQLHRRRRVQIRSNFEGYIASPEDIIIGKIWYFSEGGGERHLQDIAGILRVTGAGVDRGEVERWARELGHLDVWRQVVALADGPDRPPVPGVP